MFQIKLMSIIMLVMRVLMMRLLVSLYLIDDIRVVVVSVI